MKAAGGVLMPLTPWSRYGLCVHYYWCCRDYHFLRHWNALIDWLMKRSARCLQGKTNIIWLIDLLAATTTVNISMTTLWQGGYRPHPPVYRTRAGAKLVCLLAHHVCISFCSFFCCCMNDTLLGGGVVRYCRCSDLFAEIKASDFDVRHSSKQEVVVYLSKSP